MTSPDFSCLGTKTDPPAPTTTTEVTMKVIDFQSSDVVAGAVIDVYLSLANVNSDKPDFTSQPTGTDGKTLVMVPPGSYRVIFRTIGDPTKKIQTFEFNRPYNDSGRYSVAQSTKAEIPALVNVYPDATMGVVAGAQRDCAETEVGGVTVQMSSTGGSYSNADNNFYFVDTEDAGTLPSPSQHWTSGDGVFAGLNVPPGDVTMSSYGRLTAQGGLTKLGQAIVPLRANSITIVQLEPL